MQLLVIYTCVDAEMGVRTTQFNESNTHACMIQQLEDPTNKSNK